MRFAVRHLHRADPVLGAIIKSCGPYRIQYREPNFDTLVRSIIYQQLSGKAAATIYARLEAATGGRGVTAAAVLRLTPARLRELGLSTAKTASVIDIAEKARARKLQFTKLERMSDEDVIQHLTQARGVGVWTAQMFLMFALRRPDVFPTGDLGVRNAMMRAYGLETPPTPLEMVERARPWQPYRSVASWYLWRSLDGPAAL